MVVTFSPIDLLFYGIAVYEGYKLSFRQIGLDDLGIETIGHEAIHPAQLDYEDSNRTRRGQVENQLSGKPFVCPHCGTPYDPDDYRPDAAHIYCSACKAEIERNPQLT